MSKKIIILLAFTLATIFFNETSYCKNKEEEKIIQVVLKKMTNFKNLTELCGPYISDGYALVTSIYGEGGGQTLLKKINNKWTIVEQGGGAFTAESLVLVQKVPRKDAEALVNGWIHAQNKCIIDKKVLNSYRK